MNLNLEQRQWRPTLTQHENTYKEEYRSTLYIRLVNGDWRKRQWHLYKTRMCNCLPYWRNGLRYVLQMSLQCSLGFNSSGAKIKELIMKFLLQWLGLGDPELAEGKCPLSVMPEGHASLENVAVWGSPLPSLYLETNPLFPYFGSNVFCG